jgi:hypothetical protein
MITHGYHMVKLYMGIKNLLQVTNHDHQKETE